MGRVPLPVHNKVYELLNRRTSKKIRVKDFYKLIENLRVNGNIIDNVKINLIREGLTERQVNYFLKNLSWKIRFTREDSKNIEREMIDFGWIKRHISVIEIIKK